MKRKRKSRNNNNYNNGGTGTPVLHMMNHNDNGTNQNDEIDDCMAEFDAAMMNDNDDDVEDDDEHNHDDDHNNTPNGTALLLPRIRLDQDDPLRQLWNPNVAMNHECIHEGRRKRSRIIQPPFTSTMLPNLTLEITRNSQTCKLSSYLLTTVADALKYQNDAANISSSNNNNNKNRMQQHKQLRMPAFERWLLDCKLEERLRMASKTNHHNGGYVDPVLPMMNHGLDENDTNGCSDATKRLVAEIVEVGVPTKRARQICYELCTQCKRAVRYLRELASQMSMAGRHYRIELVKEEEKKKKKKKLSKGIAAVVGGADTTSVENDLYTLILHRSKKQNPFVCKINAMHYRKLHQMYTANCSNNNDNSNNDVHLFHIHLMAILIRYSTLSGGQQLKDLRGGGMQGAIHAQVFDFLHEVADCRMECFASPMNAYYCFFLSAFGMRCRQPQLDMDIDAAFGGCGDFFAFADNHDDVNTNGGTHEHTNSVASLFQEGCFECNPPFAPGLMLEMVHRLEQHLVIAEKNKCKLTFIIVVPSGDMNVHEDSSPSVVQMHAQKSFRKMLRSRFKKRHVVLRSREHGYVEGSQHLRPTRFKESQYDTSVLVLSSCTSWCKLHNLDEFDQGLKAAFASRHLLELKQRQRRTTLVPSTSGTTVREQKKKKQK
mmetsp:Transcript_24919/g.38537  ORF Transcript_24919/g.38537 Transcript_24919/m.38537 type:complete len:659 (-) Transcript_24919:120-2096(-)